MIERISDQEIECAKLVLKDHVVPELTQESALEAGLFCIGSQATPFEIASRLVYQLRKLSYPKDSEAVYKISSLDVLTDPDIVNHAASAVGWRFARGKRFTSFINYFNLRDNWWQEVKTMTPETREIYVKEIDWLAEKTASFWSICLGGTDVIALDVHVMRGLKNLAVDVKEDYIVPKSRNIGIQKVRKTPSPKDYVRIESEAFDLFSRDERFRTLDGKVDGALIDAVLWWGGANRGDSNQRYLFSAGGRRSGMIMPYANLVN